jgi:hypothetical protein
VAGQAAQGQVRPSTSAAALTIGALNPTVVTQSNTIATPTAAPIGLVAHAPTVSTSGNTTATAGTAAIGLSGQGTSSSIRPVAGVSLAVLAAAQAAASLAAVPGVATTTISGQAPKGQIAARAEASAITMTAPQLRAQLAAAAQLAALQVLAWAPSISGRRLTLQVKVPTTIYRLLVDDFVVGPASVARRIQAATVMPTSLRRLVDASGEAIMYQDIELVEGDQLTLAFSLTYKDVNGVWQAFDLTGFSALTLRCKNNPNDADGSAFFSGTGTITGSPTAGTLDVPITSTATINPGRFHYALKGTKAAVPRTLAHGEWIIANV